MIYGREKDNIETYQRIVKMYMLKNLLIYFSEERIIIYDLSQKENLSYIPIKKGKLAFLDPNYYNIQMFFHTSDQVIMKKSLWKNTSTKINDIKYSQGCFISRG